MKFFLAAGFILPSLVLASASPASPMENNNMKRSSEGTMGCGAYGPLGSQSTVIFGYCTPGTRYVRLSLYLRHAKLRKIKIQLCL